MTFRKTSMCSILTLGAFGLAACGGGGGNGSSFPIVPPAPAPAPVQVGDTIALTTAGKLISFNRATPGTLV
ncbi:MAG: hypothetical protein WKG52_06980 [Variovorax sp.]